MVGVMRPNPILWCLAALGACSAEEMAESRLAGAVCPAIPVFEPAEVESSEPVAFAVESDSEEPAQFEGRTWRLATSRPLAEVLAFYGEVALPEEDVEADSELDDPDVGWAGFDDDEEPGGDGGEEQDGDGSARALELPSRVFRLASTQDTEVEVSVYLQPVQRKFWFSITETRKVTTP